MRRTAAAAGFMLGIILGLGWSRTACATHDPFPGNRLAGDWRMEFPDEPLTGTINFQIVSLADGKAAFDALDGEAFLCPDDSTFYTGTFTRGGDSGPVAGCVVSVFYTFRGRYRSTSVGGTGPLDIIESLATDPPHQGRYGFVGEPVAERPVTFQFVGDGGGACPAVASSSDWPEPLVHSTAPAITHVDIPPQVLAEKEIPIRVSYIAECPGPPITRLTVKISALGTFSDGTVNCRSGRGTCTFGQSSAEDVKCLLDPGPTGKVFPTEVTIGDQEGLTSEAFFTSFQCVHKPMMAKWLAQGGAVVGGIATVAAILNPGATVLRTAVSVGAAALGTGIGIGVAVTTDPPDPNFMVIAEPIVPSIPTIPPEEGITPELAAVLNALYGNYAQVAGLAMAFLKSIERAQGAGAAGDVEWYAKQMDAARQRLGAWASLLDAQPALHAQVTNLLQAAGLADLGIVSSDDVLAFQDDVAVNGLPSDMTDLLDQLGVDSATRQVLADALLGLDPDAVAGNVLEKLSGPDFTAALQEAAQELNQVFAVPACIPGQCEDGDACTLDTCTAGQCAHAASSGIEALCSPCQAGLQSAACVGQSLPAGFTKRLTKACDLRTRAAASKPKRAKALLKQAAKNLRKARGVVKKRQGDISGECAALLTATLESAT